MKCQNLVQNIKIAMMQTAAFEMRGTAGIGTNKLMHSIMHQVAPGKKWKITHFCFKEF